jgi:hypothetical protein
MAITFQKLITAFSGNSPLTSPAFTPSAASDTLIFVSVDFSSNVVCTFSGTGGTYTTSGGSFPWTDPVSDETATGYLLSASGSSQTTTCTATSGDGLVAQGIDYSGVSSVGAPTVVNRSAPGTGANAIIGTAVTVPSGSTLLSFCYNASSGTDTITTSGTNLGSGTGSDDFDMAYCWSGYAGSGGSITPAYTTSADGTDGFVVIQWLLTPAASPGAMTSFGAAASAADAALTGAGALAMAGAAATSGSAPMPGTASPVASGASLAVGQVQTGAPAAVRGLGVADSSGAIPLGGAFSPAVTGGALATGIAAPVNPNATGFIGVSLTANAEQPTPPVTDQVSAPGAAVSTAKVAPIAAVASGFLAVSMTAGTEQPIQPVTDQIGALGGMSTAAMIQLTAMGALRILATAATWACVLVKGAGSSAVRGASGSAAAAPTIGAGGLQVSAASTSVGAAQEGIPASISVFGSVPSVASVLMAAAGVMHGEGASVSVARAQTAGAGTTGALGETNSAGRVQPNGAAQISLSGAGLTAGMAGGALLVPGTITMAAVSASTGIAALTGTLPPPVESPYGYAIIIAEPQGRVRFGRSEYLERTTCIIEAAFYDDTRLPWLPAKLNYSLIDVESRIVLLPWRGLTPAVSLTLAITSGENAMVNVTRHRETHEALFQIVDLSGGVRYARVLFDLIRVAGLN